MYHFVGADEKLKGISLEDFRAQLDYLSDTRHDDDLVLTFDHGTIDHIDTVAPELESRDLKGVFFILTMVPEDHRVHPIDQQRFLEADYRLELARMLCSELSIDYTPYDAEGYLAEYGFYSLEERYLRLLRDKIVSEKDYASVIGNMFYKAFGNEKEFCIKNYLSWDHITQLHKRGHIIGSHSHNHYGDGDDYAKSLALIERVLNEKPRQVSYPNGVKRISDEKLEGLGVDIAYVSGENGQLPYRAARLDCNKLEIKQHD